MLNNKNVITANDAEKTVGNVIKVGKSGDIIQYVEKYISDKDTVDNITRLLKLPDNKRQREFWDRPDLKKWFLNELVGAALEYYLQKNNMSGENTPEAYMHKDKLFLMYSNAYSIKTKDYRDDASISFNVPYQLHRVFTAIKKKMGTYSNTVDVVLRYGTDCVEDTIGNYKHVCDFSDVIRSITTEYEINYPMRRGGSLTNSMYEMCGKKTCSIHDVIDGSQSERVRSGHSNKDIVIKFTQMCASASIEQSEMFSLCLMLFVAKSNENWENLFTSDEVKYYDSRLCEMKDMYNDAADDMKNILKVHLVSYSIMDKEFTKTISLLSDLKEKDEYFSDIFDAMDSEKRVRIDMSYNVSDDIVKLQHELRNSNDKVIQYQKEVTEYKNGNDKLREIIANYDKLKEQHAQQISDQQSVVNKVIEKAGKRETEIDTEINKQNAEINELCGVVEKQKTEIVIMNDENQKIKNSFSWRIISKIKNLFRIT